MAENQGNEFEEVGIQDVIDLMTQEVAKLTREKVVALAQTKRLVSLVEESRAHVIQLRDEVQRLTALADAPKGRGKAKADKPAEDMVPGELVEAVAEETA